MSNTEQWKVVPIASNYAVSTRGRVKNIKTGKIRKANVNNYGYMQVGLRSEGKTIFRLVHRLVADAWLPNPDNLTGILHKDHNKQNNDVSNLKWVRHSPRPYKLDSVDNILRDIDHAIRLILNKYIPR